MDSFLKDVLSTLILTSWVLPVAYLTLVLLVDRLASLVRLALRKRNPRSPAPPPRHVAFTPAGREAADARLPGRAHSPVGVSPAPSNPLTVRSVVGTTARLARPRVGARWKSSQRLSVATCQA